MVLRPGNPIYVKIVRVFRAVLDWRKTFGETPVSHLSNRTRVLEDKGE